MEQMDGITRLMMRAGYAPDDGILNTFDLTAQTLDLLACIVCDILDRLDLIEGQLDIHAELDELRGEK